MDILSRFFKVYDFLKFKDSGSQGNEFLFYSKRGIEGFVIPKQVKINAGKIERRFGVVMTPFSSSKMIQINCQE